MPLLRSLSRATLSETEEPKPLWFAPWKIEENR
jgi:hypothetical protein